MEIDERKLIEIHLLLDRLFDGEATEEEALEVQNLIQKSAELQRYYFRYVEVKAGLHQLKSLDSACCSSLEKNYDDMFFELAQYEKTAPEMKRPAVPKEPETAEAPAESRKECFQVSKFSIFFLLLSSAALIFVIAYAHLVSMKRGVETATLTDSLNAQWADENGPLEKGSRLFTSRDGLRLRAGLAELQFDNHTRITIEGPAEFALQAADRLLLRYGRLYASVPPEAIGFKVNTPYARITDLGTEFGVISSPSGDTEVHVFRGQTLLAGGGQKAKQSVLNLTAGSAGIVCDNGATMKTIPYAAHAFIRKIDSRTGLVWKGESAILLTNLLAGHIFTGEPGGIEIDPAAGKYVAHENYVAGTERQGGFAYQKINSPFADGCFVPQGQQPQDISSTGLSYEFPKTSGLFHYNLSDRKTAYDTKTSSNYPLHLEPSSSEKPSLFLHPNMGITFDLNKIRRQIPTLEIQRFTAECGIAVSVREALKKMYPDGNIPGEETPSADLLILVDGKVRQALTGINLASGILKIDVEIQPADRFLTLASTDSNQSFRYDWLVLVQPELKIALADIGVKRCSVRDLWTHSQLGEVQDTLSAAVNPHGAKLYKLTVVETASPQTPIIILNNPGFDAQILNDGIWSTEGDVWGWSADAGGNCVAQNLTTSHINPASQSGENTGVLGQQAWMGQNLEYSSGKPVSIAANKSYQVSLWIGRRRGTEGSAAGILSVYLEDAVSDTPITSATYDLAGLSQGQWIQKTFILNTGSTPPGVGNALRLGFMNIGTRGSYAWYGQTVLDNITITPLTEGDTE